MPKILNEMRRPGPGRGGAGILIRTLEKDTRIE